MTPTEPRTDPTPVDDLRRLAEAATPGPWHDLGDVESIGVTIATDPYAGMDVPNPDIWRSNAAYIAAANAVPALLDRLAAAESQREALEDRIRALPSWMPGSGVSHGSPEADRYWHEVVSLDAVLAALKGQP